MPLVDARKTSLMGVQNSKKKSARRYAARGRCSASSLGQTPPPLGKKLDPPLQDDNVCKRVSKMISFMGRLRTIIDKEHVILIYNSFILPQLDYADIVWELGLW